MLQHVKRILYILLIFRQTCHHHSFSVKVRNRNRNSPKKGRWTLAGKSLVKRPPR